MECTLAALVACFSWANFYVDGGLSWQDRGLPLTESRAIPVVIDNEPHTFYTSNVRYDRKNPYASGALGYEIRFRSLSLALEASHRSSAAVGYDEGINSIGLKARWYPFR
jgi:hypothetical protein